MKKVTDERLVLQNLQHIRIAYIVQTLGILAILGYELFTGGLEAMRNNPLWFVFIVTTVVYTYLSMSTSIAHEQPKNPKKGLVVGWTVVAAVSVIAAILTAITPESSWRIGAVVGGVLLVCGAIPVYYVYHLRKKQLAEWEE